MLLYLALKIHKYILAQFYVQIRFHLWNYENKQLYTFIMDTIMHLYNGFRFEINKQETFWKITFYT